MKNNVNHMADQFKALGDPTRLKILKMLLSTEKLCVGMIAHNLGITQPAVSQHLKVLKHAGIVEANKIGNHVHYEVIDESLDLYRNALNALFGSSPGEKGEKELCTECPEGVNP